MSILLIDGLAGSSLNCRLHSFPLSKSREAVNAQLLEGMFWSF